MQRLPRAVFCDTSAEKWRCWSHSHVIGLRIVSEGLAVSGPRRSRSLLLGSLFASQRGRPGTEATDSSPKAPKAPHMLHVHVHVVVFSPPGPARCLCTPPPTAPPHSALLNRANKPRHARAQSHPSMRAHPSLSSTVLHPLRPLVRGRPAPTVAERTSRSHMMQLYTPEHHGAASRSVARRALAPPQTGVATVE